MFNLILICLQSLHKMKREVFQIVQFDKNCDKMQIILRNYCFLKHTGIHHLQLQYSKRH